MAATLAAMLVMGMTGVSVNAKSKNNDKTEENLQKQPEKDNEEELEKEQEEEKQNIEGILPVETVRRWGMQVRTHMIIIPAGVACVMV